MKPIALIMSVCCFIVGSCKQQKEQAKQEQKSDTITRADFVGTWEMSPLPASDPPIVLTFHLSGNGKMKISSEYRSDTIPQVDPFSFQGYWHYAKLDGVRDLIIFRDLGKEGKVASGIESFQAFEVNMDSGIILCKPLKEYSQYDWLLSGERELKRVK